MYFNSTGLALAYLAGVNLLAFLAFRDDKIRAESGDRRIPERTMLSLALWGGSLGALFGQQHYRHKTRKQPFRTWLILISLLHILLAAALFWFSRHGLPAWWW